MIQPRGMKRFAAIIAVSLMLLIAGCGGSPDQPDSVGPDNTEPDSGGLLSDPPPQNPWESQTITVSVMDKPDDRNYAPMINESLGYWNGEMAGLGWEGRFVYKSNTSDPDVPVQIVPEVRSCYDDLDENTIGCAPIYNQTGAALDRGTQPVQLQSKLNDTSTVRIANHEFGHTLGLTHDDSAEYPIMNASIETAVVDQPNVTERANPFEDNTIDVYYNDTANGLNDYILGEFDQVWQYYNNGESEIVPSNVTFRRTENESTADIELRIVENLDGGVSTVQWRGYDPDADGAFETYATATVIIDEEVNQDNMAWHTGSWTTYLFSSQEEGALPEELTSRDADTWRRWPS